ncbi:protein of unknown function [Candidatus Nitrosotalea okcheonensis]|uniref:Uncharacterized protein n=1 Tax=Candidatus Nitrosotalea okcheonensis TaxID=1903276 RepID=A0A2H1FHJ5_9ARCH|nr:protein of unknown function [Candidatus Nitrosotalea okcheonensis]
MLNKKHFVDTSISIITGIMISVYDYLSMNTRQVTENNSITN